MIGLLSGLGIPSSFSLPLGISSIIIVEPSAPHLNELHDHNPRQMTISNYNYHSATESHKRSQDLAIGDEVLIRVHPERFPLEIFEKTSYSMQGSIQGFEEI